MRKLCFIALLFGSGCATPAWQQAPHDVRFQTTPAPELHPRPAQTRPTDWWYTLEQTTTRPLGQALSPIYWIDKASDGPLAHDINSFGEVLDSTWFENRIGRASMSVADVARGPNTLDGPAEGPLYVLNGKVAGASPGLIVRDSGGHRFVVKFDPAAYPGLASSAEVVTTKVLHAAGYFVPENYVVRFRASRLVLEEGAVGPGRHGTVKPLSEESLGDLMMLANPQSGGEMQALFSRIVDGEPVGPFSYSGTRPTDPNDRIPHDRRRSLRGYRWFCAWVNNTDTRASNTLDVFRSASPEGPGHLVHYMIDFGNALGSLGTKPKYQSDGYEPILSWPVLAELFFTAGLRYRYWLPAQRSPYRSVGMFEGDVFEPERWSPSIPNPAFDASTALDDYWAASIMARFTPDMVRAIVNEGAFREPEAGNYVFDVLMKRREKILRMAFERVSPLDDAEVRGEQAVFRDLAVEAGLERGRTLRYRWQLRPAGEDQAVDAGVVARLRIPLGGALSSPRGPFFTLDVFRERDEVSGPALHLHLRVIEGRVYAVGLDRDVD